ncbi:hypothetical protein [Diaphorobacter caeni]|nr:hypothetical protein [Diaphorobacter caeni]MBF5007669.1 hypothetical protein [Diaphorobacter caeni]
MEQASGANQPAIRIAMHRDANETGTASMNSRREPVDFSALRGTVLS